MSSPARIEVKDWDPAAVREHGKEPDPTRPRLALEDWAPFQGWAGNVRTCAHGGIDFQVPTSFFVM